MSHPLFPEGFRRPERPPAPEPEPLPPPKTPLHRTRHFLIGVGIAIVVLLASAWWYLFGPNPIASADLVPGDTLVLLAIPNGAALATAYPASHLRNLISSPNAQPALGQAADILGPRNLDLLQSFLPNLSGQSFIAVTPAPAGGHVGVIAAFRPKPGLGDFDAFVAKVQADFPDFLKEVAVGSGEVDGVPYQSLQHSSTGDKVCVARLGGWIVTTWGEAPLADWIARYRGKATTPSLAQNPDYLKARERIGAGAETLVYLDGRGAAATLNQLLPGEQNPALANLPAASIAVGSKFEDGDIADRYAILGEKPPAPCTFDTLKFTGPDTRFYWGRTIDWSGWADPDPKGGSLAARLKSWGENHGLDWQKNVLEALGSELSIQAEWSNDASLPEVALFLKVDHPDDFKPVIQALIDAARAGQQGPIGEFANDTQHFATIKLTNGMPFHPTITEDGDYFGVFSNDALALHSYQRVANGDLTHNVGFAQAIGDKRNGASEIAFLDAPALLDRGYRLALPYVPMAGLISPTLAARLQAVQLPADLSWLAPMGSWSLVTTPTADGQLTVSRSGIGNQGILFGGLLGLGDYLFTKHPAATEPTTVPTPIPVPETNAMIAPAPSDTNTVIAPAVPPAVGAAPAAARAADATSTNADVSTNAPSATDR